MCGHYCYGQWYCCTLLLEIRAEYIVVSFIISGFLGDQRLNLKWLYRRNSVPWYCGWAY